MSFRVQKVNFDLKYFRACNQKQKFCMLGPNAKLILKIELLKCYKIVNFRVQSVKIYPNVFKACNQKQKFFMLGLNEKFW